MVKENDKTELMRKVKEDVIDFKESPLYKYRTENKYFPVIGEGSHSAEIMFVGEAPGKNEALKARPFCGASGRVLDELIQSIGLKRDNVYITNIVKDRPPDNRDPSPTEIALYAPFLDRQIEIIQPKTIATLGRFSMAYVMQKFGLAGEPFGSAQGKLKSISQIHGKVFEGKTSYGTVRIIPLYHPAVALYNGSTKDILKEDFKILLKQ